MKNLTRYLYASAILIFLLYLTISQTLILKKIDLLSDKHITSTATKKYAYATNEEIEITYKRLLETGLTEGNIGTYEKFADNIKDRTHAEIYYQYLQHGGFWNSYGSLKQFLDKYSYPRNYKGER